MRSKKILVAGVNRFAGRKLCKPLILHGTNINQFVRKSSRCNQLKMGSFSSETYCTYALNGCEVIFYLSGTTHLLNEGLTNQLAAFRAINVDAIINLVGQSAKIGDKGLQKP